MLARWMRQASRASESLPHARWQIAFAVPVESVTPNRSRVSSVIPRREIRYAAVNVTTAACNRDPNGDPATSAGSRALVRARHERQRNWCVRCSVQITLIGGNSAT